MFNEADKRTQYRQSLGEQVNNIEQEARMVLPGIQTLFGFQLMVAFTSEFKTSLTQFEQYLHLSALLLVAISGILVVAPAAYHRQANHQISEHFIELSGHFLSWALVPLALGTCIDIYLVTRIMGGSIVFAFCVSFILFLLYSGVWFIYPRLMAKKISN